MSNDKTEPTKGQQEQAPTSTQAPAALAPAQPKATPPAKGQQGDKATARPAAASSKSPTSPSKTPAPKSAPPAPQAAKPVAPVLVMRSDPAIFDTGVVKALLEKRIKLYEECIELDAKYTRNKLSRMQVDEKLRFLLAPSPIFAEGAIPGSDHLTQRFDELVNLIGGVKALVNDKPSEHEIAMKVEQTLGPRFDVLALTRELDATIEDEPVEEPTEEDEGLQPEEGQEDPDSLFDPDEEATEEVVALPDMDWTDAYEVEGAPNMEALPLDVLTLEGVGQLTVVVVPHEMSSHISAFGAELMRKDGEERACVYVRFKQAPKREGQPWRVSPLYRYSVLHGSKWATLVSITTRRILGDEAEPSIGAFIENEIKALHEKNVIGCQKLDPVTGAWVNAQTRAERKAGKSAAAPTSAASTAPALVVSKPATVVARPAQPRTVPADKRIGGLADAMKAAAQTRRPTAPAQDESLDESFMS